MELHPFVNTKTFFSLAEMGSPCFCLFFVFFKDLERVVQKGTVVTLVSNTIHVCVPLIRVVDQGTVVAVIQDLWRETQTWIKCI